MTITANALDAKLIAAQNLENAANLLSTGHWCVGELKQFDPDEKTDKFCAIGAVAYFIKPTIFNNAWSDGDVYNLVDGTVEVGALADVIAEHNWNNILDEFDKDEWDNSFENYRAALVEDDANETVFNFNDSQTDAAPVIKVFLEAARRLRA